jgi:zinc protease
VVETRFRSGYYGVAYPAPGIATPADVYGMDVLVTLLEQHPWGRLPAVLRDDAVAVRARYQTLRQPGLLMVTAQAAPEKLDQVETRVLEEIRKLRDAPPTTAELEGTKRILAGKYAIDNETFEGQGLSLGYYAAIDRWQFACTYLDQIRAVTAEQVQQVARKYLVPERAVTVILRPRGQGETP